MKMLMWLLMIMMFFVASCARERSVESSEITYRLGYLLNVCEGEQVKSMTFCFFPRPESIIDSECDCISEPARINEVMQILRRSVTGLVPEREYSGCAYNGWITVTMDKRKLMTPFWNSCVSQDKFSGYDWESRELGQKLDEWFPRNKDVNQPK